MQIKAVHIFRKLTLLVSILTILFSPVSIIHAQESDVSSPIVPASIQYTNFLYLPLVSVPPKLDLTVAWLEINQGIQDDANQVSLVANRPTAIRLYIYTDRDQPLNNVVVSLSAYRNGTLLPNSPLTSSPGTAWPDSISIPSLREDQSKSINFLSIPASWLTGQVTFVATVDPQNTIEEQDETNNAYQATVQFYNVPPLDIMVVPIQYTHKPTGVVYPPPSTSFVQEALFKLYPVSQVNVSVHAPYSFVGDLRQDYYWSNYFGTGLLDKITSLKNSEGAPSSQVYYGLIPLNDSSGGTWWPGSGIAGIGWIGMRASVGLTKSTNPFIPGDEILPHEVGHNFGRYHSPCGNPSGTDPNYPYPLGNIGQIGFQVHALPNGSIVPSTTPDIMGYCDYAWVSDYTYEGLMQDQLSARMLAMQVQSPQPVVYVRGRFDAQGNLQLLPVYTFEGFAHEIPAYSEYTLQFTNTQGEIVREAPIKLIEAEEDHTRFTAIEALIPLPAEPFTQLAVIRDGKVLARRAIFPNADSLSLSAKIGLSGSGAELHWSKVAAPVLIRYSLDGGRTWQVLDIDLSGGKLLLDVSVIIQNALIQIIPADTLNSSITLHY